jgi:hypothetical protein
MTSDTEILNTVQQAFSHCQRPSHFTNYTHCCECFEHDELLRSRNQDTLTFDDVGNGGYDPICFILPEGFSYYFPALARLALSPLDPKWGWYGPQLFFHLTLDGHHNIRWQQCSPEQRLAVRQLLEHILETRAELIDSYNCTDDLFHAIEIWSSPNNTDSD